MAIFEYTIKDKNGLEVEKGDVIIAELLRNEIWKHSFVSGGLSGEDIEMVYPYTKIRAEVCLTLSRGLHLKVLDILDCEIWDGEESISFPVAIGSKIRFPYTILKFEKELIDD